MDTTAESSETKKDTNQSSITETQSTPNNEEVNHLLINSKPLPTSSKALPTTMNVMMNAMNKMNTSSNHSMLNPLMLPQALSMMPFAS